MLEPDVVKVASPVLRGLGAGNGPWLLGKVSYEEAIESFGKHHPAFVEGW